MKKIPPKRCQAKGCTKVARKEYKHIHDTTRYFCRRHYRQYFELLQKQILAYMSSMSLMERIEFTLSSMYKEGLIK